MTRQAFVEALKRISPDIQADSLESLISPELISAHVVSLPKSVLQQAQQAVQSFFELRKSPSYIERLQPLAKKLGLSDPGNFGICMSHDFHVNEQGQLKLIEVNTNASFLFLSQILYRAAELPNPIKDFGLNQIRDMIEAEIGFHSTARKKPGLKMAIVDQKPSEQKLYIEFLFAKSLFEMWGWTCDILNPSEITDAYKFVYNRTTDFYFKDPDSALMNDFYHSKKICISPNPYEYFMTADKERLSELSLDPKGLSPEGQQVLLECKILTPETRSQIWDQRKKYFFKPLRSYGAKQSYRGESISRPAFEALLDGETLAQEFVPAPEFQAPTGEKFKYDLRFFSYRGTLQSAVARLYQGQVTNLKTLGGGFAPIKFT